MRKQAILVAAVTSLTLTLAAARRQDALPAGRAAFDAVSIKPFDEPSLSERMQNPNLRITEAREYDPKRLHLIQPLGVFIQLAYGVDQYQLKFTTYMRPLLASAYELTGTTGVPASREQMMLMLRAVLEDRFGLKYQIEHPAQNVYALLIAPGGIKFNRKDPNAGLVPTDPNQIVGDDMAHFVANLNYFHAIGAGNLDLPVVDQTGLEGDYEIRLKLPEMSGMGSRGIASPFDIPELLTKQLGLRLEKTRAPYDSFVIEAISGPRPN